MAYTTVYPESKSYSAPTHRELHEGGFSSSFEPSAPEENEIKSAEVVSWEKDDQGRAFYTIRVSTISLSSYTIERRGSEFDALRKWASLNSLFCPNPSTISLPSSTLMFSMSSYETVRYSYNRFLSYLVTTFPYPNTFEVRNFLCLDKKLEKQSELEMEGGVEGGVYVKLLQVKGLEGLSYCSVKMGLAKSLLRDGVEVAERPPSVKGSTVTNKKWNQEFLFFVKDRRNPLRISFYDTGYITSQIAAHADIDLRGLTPFHVYELWTPLVSTGTEALAQIQIRFAPSQIPKTSSLSLSSLRLTLEKRFYYPGECVRGMVTCNNPKTKPCKSVSMRLYGFSRSETTYDGKYYYRDYRVLVDVSCPLYWGERGEIGEGTYVWPFEIVLPQGLPSSLIFEEMQTRYGIKVLMESKSKKKEIYCPLYIISPHVSAIYDHTLGRGDNDSFQVQLESPVYVAGTEQRAIIHASNIRRNDLKNNTSLKIYMRYTYIHYSNSEREFKKKLKFLTVTPNIDPETLSSLPHEKASHTFTLPFKLSHNVVPTISPDLGIYFHISYEMKITCGSSSITVPFIVSQPPPLQDHPEIPPPDQLPLPNEKISFSGYYIPQQLHNIYPLKTGAPNEKMNYPIVESDYKTGRERPMFRASFPISHKFGQPVQLRKEWEMNASPCAPSLPLRPKGEEKEGGEALGRRKGWLILEGKMTETNVKNPWHNAYMKRETFPEACEAGEEMAKPYYADYGAK